MPASSRPSWHELTPQARRIIIASRDISRRDALRGAGALGLGAFLAACGTSGSSGGQGSATGKPTPAEDLSDTEKTVNWANWTLYLDYDDATKTYPTLEAFSSATGIKAKYSEDIDGNDTYYGKVQGQLSLGQDIGQDIVTLTDWMAGRMVSMGYTQEIDHANIPNIANLRPQLKEVDFDPDRRHTLTWQSGFGGIAWNVDAVPGGLRTVSDLWKPELKGRVEVLDEMRDTIGLIMAEQGVDISGTWSTADFDKAIEELTKQVDSGQIRQVKGNSYKEDLVSGDALAVICWSGDITQLNFENGDKWAFAIPEAGGTLWSDNLMVPIGARHKKNAEALMNYYYDPKVAAEVAAYVNYISPVQGAQAEMEKIAPALATNQLIFPDEASLAKVKPFRTLSADEENDFSAKFQTAIGN